MRVVCGTGSSQGKAQGRESQLPASHPASTFFDTAVLARTDLDLLEVLLVIALAAGPHGAAAELLYPGAFGRAGACRSRCVLTRRH